MNRFTEKLKNIDFGHKNGLFKQFWAKQDFFFKRELRNFLVFNQSQLHTKNEKIKYG